ncbi:MAG: DUF1624 domain-containing protein, partial [Hydrogenophilaceae bacterium]|nr:DUF1624 domain-containing protein [Hydrogenophilaceae bacterium]
SAAAGVRIASIDMLRGLVIVLMALDHVRDYFHAGAYQFDPLDPARTDAWLYATRWITHFCAPTFVFLAGTSAWLQLAKGKSRAALSRFLVTRGLWLVVLEFTIVSFGWAFAFPYMIFLQVIWAIGWSMVILAALIWLPRVAVLAIGAGVIAGHGLLNPIQPEQLGAFAQLWIFLHDPGPVIVAGQPVGFALYPVLPWAGIMAFGYGLAAWFAAPANVRDRNFLILGASMIAAFAVLRVINQYGDNQPWSEQSDALTTAMSFMNLTKYPPSLMYVCATLGPMLLLVPALERMRGPLAGWLRTYGAVPLFAYVLHIYIVHALAMAANAAAGRDVAGFHNFIVNVFTNPAALAGTGFDLWVAYLAWAVVLAILFPLCAWFARVKRTRKDWWLSYL